VPVRRFAEIRSSLPVRVDPRAQDAPAACRLDCNLLILPEQDALVVHGQLGDIGQELQRSPGFVLIIQAFLPISRRAIDAYIHIVGSVDALHHIQRKILHRLTKVRRKAWGLARVAVITYAQRSFAITTTFISEGCWVLTGIFYHINPVLSIGINVKYR